MDIITLLMVSFLGFILILVFRFLFELMSPVFTSVIDFFVEISRELIATAFLFLGLILLFGGVLFKDGFRVFFSIVILALVFLYAKQKLDNITQQSFLQKENAYSQESNGFSKLLAGLGVGYLIFGNRHEDIPYHDHNPDPDFDNFHDCDEYSEDIDPDFDSPDYDDFDD